MNGVVVRRLLVSSLVDPDEVAPRLPASVRPHVVDGGTVVGCCLLELGSVRTGPLPAVVGAPVRAAAHRMSVEWDGPDGVEVGVFVPVRSTDSRLAAAVGGRLVPGVHRRVPFATTASADFLAHRVDEAGAPFHIDVAVRRGGPIGDADDVMTATCLAARVGLSPGRRRPLDAIRMDLSHHRVEEVAVERLESPFLRWFSTLGPVTGRLLADAEVTWSRAVAPGC